MNFDSPPTRKQRSGAQKSSGNRNRWVRVYRQRIRDGLEWCRWCNCTATEDNPLTFAHLVPYSAGGSFTLTNITILCRECNWAQGSNRWPALVSLLDEELAAPRWRRWALKGTDGSWYLDLQK